MKREFIEKLKAYIKEIESNGESFGFTGFVFHSEGRFKDHVLRQRTYSKPVYFLNARFLSAEHFWNSKFNSIVDFHWTEFEGEANFQLVEFNGDVAFRKCTFKDKVDFSGAKFAKGVEFTGTTFAGDAYFMIGKKDDKFFRGESYFRNLNFEKDAKIVFWKTNLEQVSFLDTDLERITFRDVAWCQRKSGNRIFLLRDKLLSMFGIPIKGKCALWDEFRPLKESEEEFIYEKIAENYRQLVLNYERKRDYETAEDFHIGEMEMRRKKKGVGTKNKWMKQGLEWMNGYGIYKVLSNYGTSYLRAVWVLLLMVMAFPLIFLWDGFQSNSESLSLTNSSIEYDWYPDSEHKVVGIGQWFDDYKQATLYTLSIITFQRERFFQPMDGWWPHFWLFAAVIVLTSQAALVLLAIRR